MKYLVQNLPFILISNINNFIYWSQNTMNSYIRVKFIKCLMISSISHLLQSNKLYSINRDILAKNSISFAMKFAYTNLRPCQKDNLINSICATQKTLCLPKTGNWSLWWAIEGILHQHRSTWSISQDALCKSYRKSPSLKAKFHFHSVDGVQQSWLKMTAGIYLWKFIQGGKLHKRLPQKFISKQIIITSLSL